MRARLFAATLIGVIHATTLVAPNAAFALQPARDPVARPQQDLVLRGQTLFEDQQYEESVQTLSAALMRPSNTKAQKLEIYRFLALDFITLNRKDEAENAVRGLLSIEPSYTLPASESPRFRDFFTTVQKKWEAEGRPGLVKDAEAIVVPITMRHSSPSEIAPNNALDLTAHLEDPEHRVVSAKLYFRTGSRGKFVELDAALQEQALHVTIPASAVRPPLVEYYLQGFDKSGLPVVSRGDAGAPTRVAVPEPSTGWVLPVAIGGGILGAAAIVGGLALLGVFKSSSSTAGGGPGTTPTPPPGGGGNSTVTVTVGESSVRW